MVGNIGLKVAIDLGSDSVKTVFAYQKDKIIKYGKLEPPKPNDDALPAIAYYDEDEEKWLFGRAVFAATKKSFKNVVKIKELLSLLIGKKIDGKVVDQSDYYFNQYIFPNFYFPHKKNTKDLTYSQLEEKGMAFKSKCTPQRVCEMFFEYLFENYLMPSVERLKISRRRDLSDADLSIVSVYPAKARKEYVEELERLISRMGYSVTNSVSSPKGVGLFAYHEKIIPNQAHAIIADIGETDISVAKIYTYGAGISVDGADGHSDPIELGGNEIDETIRDMIEYKVSRREILGKPKLDGRDLFERGSHYQQFILMNSIKEGKTYFGLPEKHYKRLFSEGIPFNTERDVTVEILIDRNTLLEGIEEEGKVVIDGVNKGKSPVFKKISEYITDELKRDSNTDVNVLILAGGAAMTYGLKDSVDFLIRNRLKRKINVISFSDDSREDVVDEFDIPFSEKTIYSASLGGAILGTGVYKFETVAALSYATWVRNTGVKTACFFIRKGDPIPEKGGRFLSGPIAVNSECYFVDGEEVFSTTAIAPFLVGEPGSPLRMSAIKEYQLKVMSGEDGKGRILFLKKGLDRKYRSIEVDAKFTFKEGVEIDSDGRARPIALNVDKRFKYKDVVVYLEGLKDFALSSQSKEVENK